MIGCIAHPLLLRVGVSPNEHLRELVVRVTAEFQASLAHDASHVYIGSGEPTEVYFNWLPAEWRASGAFPAAIRATGRERGGIRIQRFPVDSPVTAKFAPGFVETPSGVVASIWYDEGLFLRSTIERFTSQLKRVAEKFCRCPETATCSSGA